MRGKMRRPSGDWQMPRFTISWPWTPLSLSPRNEIEPARGLIRPEMARRVVDLPAPLEPMSVTISPLCTRRDSPFTAAMLP